MMYPLRYLGFIVLQSFIIHGVYDGRKGKKRKAYRNVLDTRLKEYRSLMHTIEKFQPCPITQIGISMKIVVLNPSLPSIVPLLGMSREIKFTHSRF